MLSARLMVDQTACRPRHVNLRCTGTGLPCRRGDRSGPRPRPLDCTRGCETFSHRDLKRGRRLRIWGDVNQLYIYPHTKRTEQHMNTVATWPAQAEAWLDDRGKFAWIAAMVLGFILFWPVGLGLLAYMIWSHRLFARTPGRSCAGRAMRHDPRS